MHYKIEVVVPPCENLESAVKQVLEQFDENGRDEDGFENQHGFYDYYVIGGRWAGDKQLAKHDQEKLKAFHDELRSKKVTVSGLQWGKQSLEPESQIPMVDALWKDYFPEWDGEHCPLFSHSNDQLHDAISGDVCKVSELTGNETCSKLVIGGHYYDDSKLDCKALYQKEIWNGVNHEDTIFDGNVKSWIDKYIDTLSSYRREYVDKNRPTGDWLVVTVDIHS